MILVFDLFCNVESFKFNNVFEFNLVIWKVIEDVLVEVEVKFIFKNLFIGNLLFVNNFFCYKLFFMFFLIEWLLLVDIMF